MKRARERLSAGDRVSGVHVTSTRKIEACPGPALTGKAGRSAANGNATLRVAFSRRTRSVPMSSLRDALVKQGLKLVTDPRVVRWIQDERVMRIVMRAMSVPGKAQSFAKEKVEHAARAMSLATEAEVKDLRRTVRRLEDELSLLKNEQQPSGRKSNAAE